MEFTCPWLGYGMATTCPLNPTLSATSNSISHKQNDDYCVRKGECARERERKRRERREKQNLVFTEKRPVTTRVQPQSISNNVSW